MKAHRRAWIDLETGGLDPKVNPTLQIAIIVEDMDGKVLGKFKTYVDPKAHLVIDDKALEINGISKATLAYSPNEDEVMDAMVAFLKEHKFEKEQYEFCGYNSRFDMDFIIELFERSKYRFWTYFNYYDVDVFALVKILGITGNRFDEKKQKNVPCKKLECICAIFDVEIKIAHDAFEDIKATRKLFKKISKRFLK